MSTLNLESRVSFITCSRGDISGLTRTLNSLSSVRSSRIEIILVLSEYSKNEIKNLKNLFSSLQLIIVQVEPNGIYPAMNRGLREARTDFCIFLNGGDEFNCDSGFLDFLNKVGNSDWGYSSVLVKDQTSERAKLYRFRPYNQLLHRIGAKYVPHPSTIYRVNVLRMIGGFDPKFGIAADQAAALSLSQISHPVVGDQCFTTFYRGGLSTRSALEITTDFQKISRAHFGYFFHFKPIDAFAWWLIKNIRIYLKSITASRR